MDSLTIYECGICGYCHPWLWNADCREDANRFNDAEDYASKNGVPLRYITVRTMAQRVACDNRDPDWINAEEES